MRALLRGLSARQRQGLVGLALGLGLLGLMQGGGWLWRAYAPLPSPLRRPVTLVTVSAGELAARVRREQRQQLTPHDRCVRQSLRDLGLIATVEPPPPSLTDRPAPWWSRLATEEEAGGAAALYLQGRDTILMQAGASSVVLHHERIHAWEDQHATPNSRLARLTRGEGALDERLARRAVIEATAILLSGGTPVARTPGPDLDANAWLLAYRLAPEVLADHRGDATRLQQLAPLGVRELLFPGEGPIPAWAGGARGAGGCSDRVGALALLTLGLQLPQPEAEIIGWRLARAWRGDDLVRDGAGHTTWRIAVTPEAEGLLAATLATTASRRRSTTQIVVERP